MNLQFEIRKATVQDIEEIIRLRLELFKELGEVQSEQEEALVTTATKKYLEEALSNNEIERGKTSELNTQNELNRIKICLENTRYFKVFLFKRVNKN